MTVSIYVRVDIYQEIEIKMNCFDAFIKYKLYLSFRKKSYKCSVNAYFTIHLAEKKGRE